MVSYKWAYIRIITGTILGGVLGFYVMHREKMKERLAKYENELKKREQQQQKQKDQTELLSES
ncbi:hypothetical protein ACMD2_18876 [Ananas comosus]|uniref:Uncharacterized protein n=1 Tax=Ananas comosus TaxID=4615 RepID=A0A199UJZ4_ANACO|nr:hypothetical protein ACMD2_18876 [Ananas comosus]